MKPSDYTLKAAEFGKLADACIIPPSAMPALLALKREARAGARANLSAPFAVDGADGWRWVVQRRTTEQGQ